MTRKPVIVGLGGTVRDGSSTEKALICALRRAEALGAETRLLGGAFLGTLPIFDPRPGDAHEAQAALAEAIRGADAVIVASPGYHGSISGVVKNALDTLELTGKDPRPYLSGKAVGTIITAAGGQAGGTALMALRGVIHALRGWPTPFGAALNSAADLFDAGGACRDDRDAWQLDTVAEQVVEFAKMKAASP
ncbi:NADPH-dependent FMN reductase [Phenylobacterium sp.]|uniref:NADPH-dependent FMN reductase n=1 Tax=Phenylobacterium sp. TaxID=1871053 RepID=UPI0025E040CD|nr:NADPH-dependent FMN reductase [Phenylobacterium sp.]MBX3485265.1 NAD(P)H-dependent oxidoreductase [Phenylobacterium sp.]